MGELNGTTAMVRVNLMKNIVTSRRQPHTPLDNVNTPYNPIRLLKGAPPGQEAVNHYISELSIVKGGNHKLDTKYRKHLAMIEAVRTSTTTTTSFLGKVPWTETSSSTTPNWRRTMSTRSAVSNLNPAGPPYDQRRRHHVNHLDDDLHEDNDLADLLPDRLLSVLARCLLHKNLC